MLLTTIKRLLAQIETQYSVKVRAIKIDSERGYSLLHQLFLNRGIKIKTRAPYTEEQNSLIKRASSTIIARARAIRIGSGLPKELANECAITLLESHTVIRTRDVVFRSNTRYDGSTVYADLRVARTVKTVLNIADYEGEVEELEISELLELAAPLNSQGTKMLEEDKAHNQLIEELLQQLAKGEQSKLVRSINLGGSLVSPNTIGRRSRDASIEEEISLPKGYELRTDPAITLDNIVASKRTRGSAYAAYLSTFAVTYLSTFASAINPVKVRELHEPKKLNLESYPFGNRFKLAAQAEIDDIMRKGCFKLEAHEEGVAEGEILPLMWVFTYKFDEDGYLTKFKARLVVRGDLQQIYKDTYAATLAAQIFRFLITLMAAFGLKAF
ncbi:Pol protein [Pyrenophora tritici-repentis]|uniref:Pol protein n=2 Tax=Pyrenophora tritici-repentis TaxID=45151 RepID=A0A922SVF3_9PLEO|nr:Pol protein [Pyrenophora tritici-repentis]